MDILQNKRHEHIPDNNEEKCYIYQSFVIGLLCSDWSDDPVCCDWSTLL